MEEINKDNLIILDKNLATFLPKEFHNPYKTLFFIWYMCSICPYHCKYCCVRYSNAEWGRVMTDKEFDIACTTINNSFADNIGIMLLGGEPTAVSGFEFQLRRMFDIIKKNMFVDIRTNHFQNLDYYKKVYEITKDKSDKISWEPTYHCYKEPDIDDFINKTLFLKERYIQVQVSIVLTRNKKLIPNVKLLVDKLIKNNIGIQPIFLFDPLDDFKYPDYNEDNLYSEYEFLKELPREIKYYTNDGKLLLFNEYEQHKLELPRIHNWYCQHNYFHVSPSLEIWNDCPDKFHGSILDVNYFNKIKNNYDPFYRCNEPYCQQDGFLPLKKYRSMDYVPKFDK